MNRGLGDWILRNRERRKWTQLELANRVGARSSSISRWERALVEPTASHIRSLCEVFGLSADDALGLKKKAS